MKNFYRDSGLIISVIALLILLLGLSWYVYDTSTKVFWVIAPFVVLISGFVVGKLITVTRKTSQYFAYVDDEIENADRISLYSLPMAVAIIDSNSCFIWFNLLFKNTFGETVEYGNNISTIFNYDIETLLSSKNTIITYKNKFFEVNARRPNREEGDGEVFIIYLNDVTQKINLETQSRLRHPVVLLLSIDSYDEMFENNLDSEKAHITVKIDKLLEDFMSDTNGIMKKFNRDRVWAVLESKDVEKIVEGRVKILDKAREIAVTDRMSVTLSIGIGTTGRDLSESEQFAKQALEMAQGRGGDQAAVKTGNGFEFYGGVSKGIERHTKVKARIIANSMINLAEHTSGVYIMGHKNSDLDSVGASVGLAAAFRNIGKKAYVVVDKATSLAQDLIEKVKGSEDDKQSFFLQPNRARELFDDNSILVIVDTHNPEIVEDGELLARAKTLVVIDHHRKTVNFIDNAKIFHHEPYSSSACEMVTEVLQYFGTAGRLTAVQSEALLAGIMLDTKNFTIKTGVRTFEAAAFLRKLGADTVNVKMLFSNTFEIYKQKTMLVASAKVYRKCAIAITDVIHDNMRVVASQAADEMLAIIGVDGAFTIYRTSSSEIYVSARSLGSLNVQLIMESLGGGGHQTMAGTQMRDISIHDAESRVTSAIDLYYDNQKKD